MGGLHSVNSVKLCSSHLLVGGFFVPPRPHADGGGIYRLFTGILRFSQAVRGPVVGLTKALRPRLHRRCFVLPRRLLLLTASFVAGHSDHAFLPGTMTTGSAAWEARPPGPDKWADALVRRIMCPGRLPPPGLGGRRMARNYRLGAGREGKRGGYTYPYSL